MGARQPRQIGNAFDHAVLLAHAQDDGEGADIHEEIDRHVDQHAAHPFLGAGRSKEHTSELQSLMRISYAVFCLKKKKNKKKHTTNYRTTDHNTLNFINK